MEIFYHASTKRKRPKFGRALSAKERARYTRLCDVARNFYSLLFLERSGENSITTSIKKKKINFVHLGEGLRVNCPEPKYLYIVDMIS